MLRRTPTASLTKTFFPLLFILASISSAQITPTPQSAASLTTEYSSNRFQIKSSDPDFKSTIDAFTTDWQIQTTPNGRTISIRKNPKLAPEEYKLNIERLMTIEASTPTGLAWALQSLGQQLASNKRGAIIHDQPDVPFRSVSLDVARRFHSISTLKHLIRYCQAGKVRYIQLHLTDDQAWMFPTEVFNGVDKNNRTGRPAYTKAELKDLNDFANARGVTLIPEIDLPGHSTPLTTLDPDLLRIKDSESTNCIDFASPVVRAKLKQLLKEVAQTFPTSPYIHIGGDEAWYPTAEKDPDFAAAIAKLGPDANPGTVFIDFVAEMAEEVIKLDKTPLVWEGFHASEFAKKRIPPQTIVIAWEGWYYPAKQLLPDGFKVINGGWDPYYVVNHYPYDLFTLAPLERLYSSDPNRFGIVAWADGHEPSFQFAPSKQLIGSLMCWWEGHEWNAQKYLAPRIVAFGTSLWNRKGEQNYSNYLTRYSKLKSQIESQAYPFTVEYSGIQNPDSGEFTKHATLKLTPKNKNIKFAFRTDGNPPTADGISPNTSISTSESAIISVQAFENGEPTGDTFFYPTHKVTVIKSLSYKCPVKTTSAADPQFPAAAVTDGISDQLSSYWLGYPIPQTLTIDLKNSQPFNRIQVVAFWATRAPTHYKISVSDDEKTWRPVVDASKQTRPSTQSGYTHVFPTTTARFVRIETGVTPLFPSTMARINEIRVFNDK